MKKTIFLVVALIILMFFPITVFSNNNEPHVHEYIKDNFPSIFSFYLSSLGYLDSNEKLFIDLLENLSKEEQEYYAKEVYKKGFYPELLKHIKEGKNIEEIGLYSNKTNTIDETNKENDIDYKVISEENPIRSLPSLIKKIKPSTVSVFAYTDKGYFLQSGSGFFINQSGDVITNYHVIQGASIVEIKTSEGETYSISSIVARDKQTDIVCLSANISSQYVYPLSLSRTVPEIGENIIVYGSPLGLENTVSDGIVSAIRVLPDYGRVVQITAPISPGSSGSPVLNMNGEVVGVATFQSTEGQNLNFAIPSSTIKDLVIKINDKTDINIEQYNQKKEVEEYPHFKQAMEAYNEGFYFIRHKEYKKAIIYLKKAIDLYPISYLKKKTNKSPIFPEAYIDLANAYIQLNQCVEAIKILKQSLHINPNLPNTHALLGAAYLQCGDKYSALKEYNILKELNSNLADGLFDLIY